MTHTDYTRNILNIKDKNIYFNENCLKTRKEDGKEVKIFHGYLTYTPKFCDTCGVVNEGTNDIIKWGFDKNCLVKIPKVSNFDTILLLDKQRFFCKHCHCTFNARTSLVDFHKQISNNTKLSIILDLMNKGSKKDISNRNNVSTNSTNRILDEISENKLVKNNGILPEILGIDEFKATTDTISKMAFIIVDQDKKNIFDINNSRKSLDVEKYFKHYSKKQRDNVKFITLDLHKPYNKLMHSLFRNSILIPDRFHIVIQARNALDKTRIKLCTKSNPYYKKLKKYWKLILKDKKELDKNNKKYYKEFKKEMSQYDIVTYLLNTDNELYETYKVYQSILYSIDTRNKEIFLSIIHGKNNEISKYMKKTIKTFISMERYLLNAFDYEYSNGIVEGSNNLIKQIKHTAYGYRKFKHLKARVMLIKGLLNPIKAY